ncbi:MAG: hypothetical protein ACK56I_31205, partial [bacterium]
MHHPSLETIMGASHRFPTTFQLFPRSWPPCHLGLPATHPPSPPFNTRSAYVFEAHQSIHLAPPSTSSQPTSFPSGRLLSFPSGCSQLRDPKPAWARGLAARRPGPVNHGHG